MGTRCVQYLIRYGTTINLYPFVCSWIIRLSTRPLLSLLFSLSVVVLVLVISFDSSLQFDFLLGFDSIHLVRSSSNAKLSLVIRHLCVWRTSVLPQKFLDCRWDCCHKFIHEIMLICVCCLICCCSHHRHRRLLIWYHCYWLSFFKWLMWQLCSKSTHSQSFWLF